MLPIGKVVGTHGIKGNLKVFSYAETSAVFQPQGYVLIQSGIGRIQPYKINRVSPFKGGVILSLNDISDRNQAQEMVGAELFIQKCDLPELEKDTYYWFELIGLSVWTVDNQMIGQIDSIIQTGSNDVYVVKGPEKETLVPALASVILDIDLDQQTMRVRLPDGL